MPALRLQVKGLLKLTTKRIGDIEHKIFKRGVKTSGAMATSAEQLATKVLKALEVSPQRKRSMLSLNATVDIKNKPVPSINTRYYTELIDASSNLFRRQHLSAKFICLICLISLIDDISSPLAHMTSTRVFTPDQLSQAQMQMHQATGKLWVVCLCAAWCGTCREMANTLAQLAADWPELIFISLDIERDSAFVDSLDIDDFPTFAIFKGKVLVHYGVSLPQPALIRRLIEHFATAEPVAIEAEPQILALAMHWCNNNKT